jgi:hypothetical protein
MHTHDGLCGSGWAGGQWCPDEGRTADGYVRFPDASLRPYCDLCGPFASRDMRLLHRADDTQDWEDWRCRRCDEEC